MSDETLLSTAEPDPQSNEPLLDPGDMTPETVDLARYYTLDELAWMPVEALEELWQACPDKPFYESALAQAVDKTYGEGALDLDRLAVIERCIGLYDAEPPRIPVIAGDDGEVRWWQVSGRIKRHLEDGVPLEGGGQVEPEAAVKPRTVVVIAAGILLFLCIGVLAVRRLAGGPQPGEADLTATAGWEAAQAALPAVTPTPTPLALEDIDRPISRGEDLRGIYPVLLEIVPSVGGPRVFPVQQKAVEVAEWHYENDPDVASSVLGLVIRPVLGIPYTAANAAFLDSLRPGDAIRLQMNTGQNLLFTVSGGERVDRQAASIFDQTTPGIVIVLLADPAGDRLVIHGVYRAEQELVRGAAALPDAAAIAEMGQPAGHGDTGITITVLAAAASAGPAGAELPEGWAYLLVDLWIEAAAGVDTTGFQFELVDPAGSRCAPLTVDGAITDYDPFTGGPLEPGAERYTTLAFLVPRHLANASLLARVSPDAPPVAYRLAFAPLSSLGASDLDVLILGMETTGTPGEPLDLAVTVRLFNPHQTAITVQAGDVGAIYSPVVLEDAFPVGPLVRPTGGGLPLVVNGGEALDVAFHFAWNGDPFLGLTIGGYRFVAVLR